MKKNLIGVLVAAVALAVPSLAQGDAGQLDKDFGVRGKVTTVLGPSPAPFPWSTTFQRGSRELRTWLARTPAGEIVVLVGNTLFEYRPSGHLDRSFGTGGQVAVEAPPGTLLEPSGVTVDSRGRILVAGTVRSVDRNVASVFVARYLEEGRPDGSFGNGGIVLSDLGLSAPAPPPPTLQETNTPPPIEGPIVESSGLAVDADDRPLLTGTWASTYRLCYPAFYKEQRVSYLARLDGSGAVDPAFAGGVIVDPSSETRFSPMVDADAVLSVGEFVQYCQREELPGPELVRNKENGRLDKGFGAEGRVAAPYGVTTITRDRFGRAFVLGFGERRGVMGPQLLRLRRNGSIDERFGKGDVELPLVPPLDPVAREEDWHPALASDGRGRPLFAGTEVGGLTLGRLRRDGVADRRFGERGLIFTRTPGEVRPEQILVANGKVLVGGTWFKDGEFGIFLARYSGS